MKLGQTPPLLIMPLHNNVLLTVHSTLHISLVIQLGSNSQVGFGLGGSRKRVVSSLGYIKQPILNGFILVKYQLSLLAGTQGGCPMRYL